MAIRGENQAGNPAIFKESSVSVRLVSSKGLSGGRRRYFFLWIHTWYRVVIVHTFSHRGEGLIVRLKSYTPAYKSMTSSTSAGNIFPHPLNPDGYFPTEMLRDTFAGLYTSGKNSKFNFKPPRRFLWLLRLAWERRLRKELYPNFWDYLCGKQPEVKSPDAGWRKIEGLLVDSARRVKQNLKSAKVLVTGGWQTLGAIQAGLDRGDFDMVTGARTWMANLNAPNDIVAASRKGKKDWEPARPCSMCNRCLVAAPKHAVMCLDSTRFEGKTPEERRANMLSAGQKLYQL